MEPRWNYYTCAECKRHWVTVDVDRGVTPFLLRCRFGCKGKALMRSGMYPHTDEWPSGVPRKHDAEWFSPGKRARKVMKRTAPELLEHVEKGGLILRRPKLEVVFPVSRGQTPTEGGERGQGEKENR